MIDRVPPCFTTLFPDECQAPLLGGGLLSKGRAESGLILATFNARQLCRAPIHGLRGFWRFFFFRQSAFWQVCPAWFQAGAFLSVPGAERARVFALFPSGRLLWTEDV